MGFDSASGASPSSEASASSMPTSSGSTSAVRWSSSVMRMPLLRNAICWKRARRISKENSVVSKISSSGQKVMTVPVRSVSSPLTISSVGSPRR